MHAGPLACLFACLHACIRFDVGAAIGICVSLLWLRKRARSGVSCSR